MVRAPCAASRSVAHGAVRARKHAKRRRAPETHRETHHATPLTSAKRPIVALGDMLTLASTVFVMTDMMNVLPTRIPTIYLLAPYCGWLCYGEYDGGGQEHAYPSHVPQRRPRVPQLEREGRPQALSVRRCR